MFTLATKLKLFYLSSFSQPSVERVLYKSLYQHRVKSIVEIGMGDGRRTRRLLRFAKQCTGGTAGIQYTGIDLFEQRPSSLPSLPLKEAHRRLKETGVKFRLLPGDPFSALSRGANNLLETDLVIVASPFDSASMSQAWFYLPRMLHANSMIFQEETDAGGKVLQMRHVTQAEIHDMARRPSHRRAA